MPDPIAFSSTAPRFSLPLMFVGQSQKEITFNEAILLVDFLLQPIIEGTTTAVPSAPTPGQCWIINSGASGIFAARADQVAAWSEGGWRFIAPKEGMRVYDRARTGHRVYRGSAWRTPTMPSAPTGGTTVDTQARSAIIAITDALRDAGIALAP
jgi:hypothetical protein